MELQRTHVSDPKVGRFLSEDPLRFYEGANFYAYVFNNPVNLTDPSGLSAWDWIKRGGAVAGLVHSARALKKCYEKAKTCDEYAEEMCNSTYPEVFGDKGFGPYDINLSNRLLCKHEVRKCCLKQATAGGANVLVPLIDPFTVPECKP